MSISTPSQHNIKQDRADWEQQYTTGAWAHLNNRCELARYRVVSGFIHAEARPVSLLDLGCGEGVMLRHLDLDRIEHYTGLDVAQAALDKIKPRRSQDDYVCATLENFLPRRQWDVILFNEVLYYTFDPVASLRRFESVLKPGGWFIISMHRKIKPWAANNRCLRKVRRYLRDEDYEMLDAVELRKLESSAAWEIFYVRPSAVKQGRRDCEL